MFVDTRKPTLASMSSPPTLDTTSQHVDKQPPHKPPKQMHRPKRWREEINGVKQPCWCGEEWHDNHEDGNHGPVDVDP